MRARGAAAGANGRLLKSADAAEIVDAGRSVHEGQSVLDPAIARKLLAYLTTPNKLLREAAQRPRYAARADLSTNQPRNWRSTTSSFC